MSDTERPTVNYYAPEGAPADEQELVSRPMTDAEYEDWLDQHATVPPELEPRSPLLTMVDGLTDDELNELRELLG